LRRQTRGEPHRRRRWRALRETVDKLKDKLKSAVIVLGAVDGSQRKGRTASGVRPIRRPRLKPGELAAWSLRRSAARAAAAGLCAERAEREPQKLDAALASLNPGADKLSPG